MPKSVTKGKMPRKRDIVDWSQSKLVSFLKFVDFFTEEGAFKCTNERITDAYIRAEDEFLWTEFLDRIDMNPEAKGYTSRKFYLRFLTFTRIPLSWLKSNPHAVTLDMLETMKANPRMEWASKAFTTVTTETGVQVVELDQNEETDPNRSNAASSISNVRTPQEKYEQGLLKTTSLLLELVSGISRSEIKEMGAAKRIQLATPLLTTLAKSFNAHKSNFAFFQNININKGSRQELEDVIQKYSETQQEEG